MGFALLSLEKENHGENLQKLQTADLMSWSQWCSIPANDELPQSDGQISWWNFTLKVGSFQSTTPFQTTKKQTLKDDGSPSSVSRDLPFCRGPPFNLSCLFEFRVCKWWYFTQFQLSNQLRSSAMIFFDPKKTSAAVEGKPTWVCHVCIYVLWIILQIYFRYIYIIIYT